ncbi:MAG: methyltransferase domain-containing protein [Bacteroidota bacterium]|nr:class I SAM-dependent methyltransferase [bacterium]MBU1873951.1 class I SAM-dependent methyltransferase [bacterium]
MEISKDYWSKRYTKDFSFRSSAHLSFSYEYNQYVYRAYIRTLELLMQNNKIFLNDKHILDIGSGTGYYVDYYKINGVSSLIGTDITDISVTNLTKTFPEYQFVQNDIASQLPALLSDNKYDIISIFDVLYYIIDDNLFRKAVENISKLCDNNSTVIITDRFIDQVPSAGLKYFKFRSIERYTKILNQNGLKIIDRKPVNYLLKKKIPLQSIYSFLKWELKKIHIDLEKIIGAIQYSLDPFIMSEKKSDIQMIFAKKIR